jgi:hypothetical protein
MATESPEAPEVTVERSREQVAADLVNAMDEAARKAINGRVADAENERVRIKWMRAFVAAATEYRQQMADIDEKREDERLERLEQQIEDLHEVM